MADYMKKLSKAFEKDKTNPFLKNALNRTNEANIFQSNQEYLSNLWGNTVPDVAENVTSPVEGMGFTAGDYVGLAGTAIGAFSEMANTIANARATKPVVNHYEGFNEKALASNQAAKDELGYRESQAKTELSRNLATSENTARSRTRNSASGMNTMRALDLGVDVSANEAKAKGTAEINNAYSQQLMSLMGIDTQLLSEKDKAEMAGRTAADDANAANLDNFYSNFAQNIAGTTQSIQKVGSDINQAKYRNDVLKLIPGSNKWGVGVDANMNTYSTLTKPDKYAPAVKGITENVVPNFNYMPDDFLNILNQ